MAKVTAAAKKTRLNYTNGYYEGEYKDSVKHGRGKYVASNGDTYTGD